MEPLTVNNSKTTLTILVITVFVTAIVVGSGVFLWQQGVKHQEIQQAIEKVKTEVAKENAQSDVANWKTYTNKYYQYQINVPVDWNIEEIDYNNDPIVRLSSPNKEIIISSRGDDHSIDSGGTYSNTVDMPSAQVGNYTVPRYYQHHITGENKQAYSMLVYASRVSHPSNLYLPPFRIEIKGDLEKNDPLILQILKTFKNTGTLKNLNDLIKYSIPSGWNPTTDAQGGVTLQSPDYIQSPIGVIPEKGGQINVSSSFNLPGHTLESEKNNWKQTAGVSDISDATINGIPAFEFHADDEGHGLAYYAIKDGYGFNIYFNFPNLAEEKKYQKLINKFLDSVHFK